MAHGGQEAHRASADGTTHAQVLHVLLSSEADAQFLHMLEVSEDEFQALKAQQGILVDFGGFPGKVVSLLRKCSAARAEQPPRFTTGSPVCGRASPCDTGCRRWVEATGATGFVPAAHLSVAAVTGTTSLTWVCLAPRRFQAVLSVRPGEATLQVMETTDFNQLPHVTLAFRPGSDAAVKAFLASRLAEVKAERAALAQQLSAAAVRASLPCPAHAYDTWRWRHQ